MSSAPFDIDTHADPRRWITLAIVITSAFIVVLDNSVLNVAIPTILRDFHTTLPTLQWVITGYSLVFAAMMIIGGRLADIHGARQTWIVGTALFGVGSLIAALSTGVLMLVIGEAIIEGIGAALLLPSGLAILTSTFHGRERATAFALWTAVMGASYAFGPVIGGFLTTEF
ncbi:MAG TPA: MFS transporter, partial [Acidimicrobiia bacterium]